MALIKFFEKQFFKRTGVSKLLLVVMSLSILIVGFDSYKTLKYEGDKDRKAYDIVLDYTEMEKMADESEYTLEHWLKMFRDEFHIDKVGLTEENLLSLSENPRIPVRAEVTAEIFKDVNWRKKYPEPFLKEIEKKGIDNYDVIVSVIEDDENCPYKFADGTVSEDSTYNKYAGKGDTSSFLEQGIENRIEKDKYVKYVDGDNLYFWIDGNSKNALYSEKYKLMSSTKKGFIETRDVISSKIMFISLGFWHEKINQVRNLGFEVIPRTLSYTGYNGDKFAESVIEEYEMYGINPSYIIVAGEGIVGYDSEDKGEKLADFIRKNGSKVSLIENNTQRQNILQLGLEDLAKRTSVVDDGNSYNAVRVFTVWDFIQNRWRYYGYKGAEEITNTLFRAITERNIRVIYFKPVKYTKDWSVYVTDEDVYRDIFTTLEKRLDDHGFYRGQSTPFYYGVEDFFKIGAFDIGKNLVALAPMMLFILGMLLLVNRIFKINQKVYNFLVGFSILLGIIITVAVNGKFPSILLHLIGFGISVVFACLSIVYFISENKKVRDKLVNGDALSEIAINALKILIISVAISLLGGLAIRSLFNGQSYFLEINIFRGVKLAQIIPILFFPIAYMTYFGVGDEVKIEDRIKISEIKYLLNIPIKAWMLIVGVILTGLGVYYMMRTGHESSIEVSSTEMLVRNYLEEVLVARPRNKEFLFAFPSLMLMVYAGVKKMPIWTIIFGLAGVIGMTSVNNTFMHIRTPLYLGIARTGYSLLFGAILGLIAIICFHLFNKIVKKFV